VAPPAGEAAGANSPSAPPPPVGAQSPPEKKRSYWWLWIVGGVIVIAIILGLLFGLTCAGTTEVPDLSGLTLQEAAKALNEADLELGKVIYTTDFPDGVQEGQTITQEPASGTEVDTGTSVDLVVAMGEGDIEVPDLTGLSADDATKALEAAGFEVKVVETESDAEAGTVVDQSPEPGAMVAPGSTVTIIVSAGVAEILVPKVVGMTQEEATSTLEEAGYKVEVETTYDETIEKGIVISQEPEAGVSAEAGTVVTILVSDGKNPEATVPDVVGQTEADAAKALEDAGFVAVSGGAYSETVPVGVVIAQDPTAGETAKIGNPVSLTVSLGPEPPETAVVPDVTGKTEDEANQLLTEAGYTVVTAYSYTDLVPENVVGFQLPIGGSVTEPGLQVGILVSQGPRPPEFVIVPDVRDMTLADATQILEEAGLQALGVEVFTTLAPEGQVVAQIPLPEWSVSPDATVILIVSKGPPPEVTPY